MGWDSCSSSSPATSTSPAAGKRGRDPEEEVYLDNFHSQKRYLSEIMASSLNGLTVGESLTESLMESPLRSETICIARDEITSQYSPMSEDLDDIRFCDAPSTLSLSHSDSISNPTSPVSPHRHQRPSSVFYSSNPYPLPGCTLPTVVCSHPRHRGSDSEGRFPSSPNDMCHSPDLRRAALLRSVQMRAQPYCRQENLQNAEEEEDSTYVSCIKTLEDETCYRSSEQLGDFPEDCSSVEDISEVKIEEADVLVPGLHPGRS